MSPQKRIFKLFNYMYGTEPETATIIGGKKGEDFSYKTVGSGVMDVDAVINAATAAGSEWIQ